MPMKNKFGLALALLAIVLVVYNVIVFVLPIPRTPSFWVAYVFTMIAILLQVAIDYVAARNDWSLKSIFLSLPTANVGAIYLTLQIIWCAVVMALSMIPIYWAVVVSVVLLGWCLVSVFLTTTAREVISTTEEKTRTKTNFIKMNQIAVELLINKVEDAVLKKKLSDLHDTIRFSDPMSDKSLVRLEAEIEVQIEDLKAVIASENSDSAVAMVTQINDLMLERNKLCKAQK